MTHSTVPTNSTVPTGSTVPAGQTLAPPVATATLKCDLHLHTSDDQYDRIPHDVLELIDRGHELGYDCLAVTNHLTITPRPDAEDYAAARGMLLLRGVELTIHGRHVLFINPPEDLEPGKIKDFTDLRSWRREESLIIPAHPFYPGPTNFGDLLEEHAELWDAIELCHFYTRRLDFNHRGRELSDKLGLPLVATSDTHHLSNFGSSWSAFRATKEPLALARALRGGLMEAHTAPRGNLELLKVGWRTWRCGDKAPVPAED